MFCMQEDLGELHYGDSARGVFSKKKKTKQKTRQFLSLFLFRIRNSRKRPAEPAIRLLLLFLSIGFCESTFLTLQRITANHGSNLKTHEHDLRCVIAEVSY